MEITKKFINEIAKLKKISDIEKLESDLYAEYINNMQNMIERGANEFAKKQYFERFIVEKYRLTLFTSQFKK